MKDTLRVEAERLALDGFPPQRKYEEASLYNMRFQAYEDTIYEALREAHNAALEEAAQRIEGESPYKIDTTHAGQIIRNLKVKP